MLSFLIAFSGCTRYYYAPNQHNVPLFKEKNEVRLSGTLSAVDGANGFEIQGGYAITKGLAVVANGGVFRDDSLVRGHIYELGLGYFKPIPSTEYPKISEKFVFEIYGITGLGSSRIFYCHPEYSGTKFFKGYIQPSVGFTHDIIDVFISTKMGVLHFYDVNHTFGDTCINPLINTSPEVIIKELQTLKKNRTNYLAEPALSIRIGYKYLKFHYQIGWSNISNAQDFNSGINMNLGLIFSFTPRFKKGNKKEKGSGLK